MKKKNNVLEEVFVDCGCDINNINSCLVIGPKYFNQFRKVGNCLVEYYNLPFSEEELMNPDGSIAEMQEVIDDILNYISGREFDAMLCATTTDIKEEYSLGLKILENVNIKKYEITYFNDIEMCSVFNHLANFNRVEKMLIDAGCNVNGVNNINSCLLVAPSSYSDIKKVGNASVEYYTIPEVEELEGGENEMRRKLVEIANSVYKRKFDAVVCILTDEIDDKYNFPSDLHDCVEINKYEFYLYTDSLEAYVNEY